VDEEVVGEFRAARTNAAEAIERTSRSEGE
jgi:hypothetical protein